MTTSPLFDDRPIRLLGIGDDATRQRASRMVSEVIRFVRMHRLLILDETHYAEQERTAGV